MAKKNNLAPLVDQYCEISQEIARLTKLKDALKEELVPACDPLKPLKGTKFCIQYSVQSFEHFDSKIARDVMGAEWASRFTETRQREILKVVKL